MLLQARYDAYTALAELEQQRSALEARINLLRQEVHGLELAIERRRELTAASGSAQPPERLTGLNTPDQQVSGLHLETSGNPPMTARPSPVVGGPGPGIAVGSPAGVAGGPVAVAGGPGAVAGSAGATSPEAGVSTSPQSQITGSATPSNVAPSPGESAPGTGAPSVRVSMPATTPSVVQPPTVQSPLQQSPVQQSPVQQTSVPQASVPQASVPQASVPQVATTGQPAPGAGLSGGETLGEPQGTTTSTTASASGLQEAQASPTGAQTPREQNDELRQASEVAAQSSQNSGQQ